MNKRFGPILCLVAALAGCGGGGGGSDTPPPPVTVTPPPTSTPSPTPSACTLRARQDWVAARLQEDYLFPDLLTTVDPTGFSALQPFIDAMTAPARAAGKDKLGFSYVTSIQQENALINSGATAGFGIRLQVQASAGRLFVSEAFEGASALAAGIDRGTEILAIGTSASNLQTVSSILASQGSAGITAALGPSEAGVTRTLQVRSAGGTESTVTITKTNFSLDPVSDRYGAKIIDDGGRKVGYVNLRTFITDTADPQLREVFANFRAQNVTEVIVDLRYNGGGLVRIGELLANLLGGQRTSTDVLSQTRFNARLASSNSTAFFQPQPQSVAATKIAFIGTEATASASELVMNAFIPYLGANAALVGSNTFGKPVGQIARDRAECDDRFRIMAFQTVNRDGQGDYFNGLAPFFRATCRAADDISRPLGDSQEASVKAALDFLAGRSCTPITSGGITTQSTAERPELLRSTQPTAAQHEVPGLF
jgi:carboxyl-terminal processing protease